MDCLGTKTVVAPVFVGGGNADIASFSQIRVNQISAKLNV